MLVSCADTPPEVLYPEPQPLPVVNKKPPVVEPYVAKLPDEELPNGYEPSVDRYDPSAPPALEKNVKKEKPHKLLTAEKVPGRPGFVLNPYNQNMVDVQGIPSGIKIRDPHDPDESHVFLVP